MKLKDLKWTIPGNESPGLRKKMISTSAFFYIGMPYIIGTLIWIVLHFKEAIDVMPQWLMGFVIIGLLSFFGLKWALNFILKP